VTPLASTNKSLTLVIEGDVDVEESKGVGRGIDVDEDEAGVDGTDAGCEAVVIVETLRGLVSALALDSIAGIIVSPLNSVTCSSTLCFSWVFSSYTSILILALEITEEPVVMAEKGEMEEEELEDDEKSCESSLPSLPMLSAVSIDPVGAGKANNSFNGSNKGDMPA